MKMDSSAVKKEITSSEDSISDSLLESPASATEGGGGIGGAGIGGGVGTEVGRGGVGSAALNGAGIFILFIKCKTYEYI